MHYYMHVFVLALFFHLYLEGILSSIDGRLECIMALNCLLFALLCSLALDLTTVEKLPLDFKVNQLCTAMHCNCVISCIVDISRLSSVNT